MVLAQRVEEVFTRNGLIWELRLGGQTIRSTAEHPFYRDGDGWVPLHRLRVGDRLKLEDGSWSTIEGVCDTGRYEAVYNFRVREFHTYFVGDETTWDWAVWAHNRACGDFDEFSRVYGDRVFERLDPTTQVRTRLRLQDHAPEFQQHLWEVYQTGSDGRLPRVIGGSPDVLAHTGRHPTGRKIIEGVLNDTPHGWSQGANDAWMLGGIDSRKTFYLVTKPTETALVRPILGVGDVPRVYLRELQMLRESGYRVPTNLGATTDSGVFVNAWAAGFIGL